MSPAAPVSASGPAVEVPAVEVPAAELSTAPTGLPAEVQTPPAPEPRRTLKHLRQYPLVLALFERVPAQPRALMEVVPRLDGMDALGDSLLTAMDQVVPQLQTVGPSDIAQRIVATHAAAEQAVERLRVAAHSAAHQLVVSTLYPAFTAATNPVVAPANRVLVRTIAHYVLSPQHPVAAPSATEYPLELRRHVVLAGMVARWAGPAAAVVPGRVARRTAAAYTAALQTPGMETQTVSALRRRFDAAVTAVRTVASDSYQALEDTACLLHD